MYSIVQLFVSDNLDSISSPVVPHKVTATSVNLLFGYSSSGKSFFCQILLLGVAQPERLPFIWLFQLMVCK